ncbi:OmpA family protein [Aestuariispira ectoiniformans]|uniref:OmpA family protein n=1 Tax=Aestuariispira ectoiniformans TaxID=2775080 RepID=UPI00223AF4B2|nr:OmpA family protein [Aestuariispira ectoiniformans]
MKLRTSLPVLALTAVLAVGCANRFEDVKANGPAGGEFEKGLHAGYVQLAEMERNEYDWADGRNFTDRAAMVTEGQMVMPEEMSARSLPERSVPELTSARARLMKAFAAGGKEAAPMDAAHAQVMFDCWMQEQEEDLQPDDIAKCRAGFMAAMDKVDAAMKPMPMKKAEPMKMAEPLPEGMTVYFAFDSAKLQGASDQTINDAVSVYKNMDVKTIRLMGHTDKAGNNGYNAQLAEKRVMAVRNALIGKGVPANAIDTSSYGENRPAVPTKDNMREPKNRRVEFVFIR